MSELLRIDVGTLPEGVMRSFEAGKKSILVANLSGRFHAINNRCTHLGCRLSKGTIVGSVVTCPCHGTRFDITSGKMIEPVSRWPKIAGTLVRPFIRDAKVYSVTINDGQAIISE